MGALLLAVVTRKNIKRLRRLAHLRHWKLLNYHLPSHLVSVDVKYVVRVKNITKKEVYE